MKKYIPAEIEAKWAKKWKDEKLFSPDLDQAKKPFYSLMMFPYPSAEGMHVGNMYAFTGSDVYSRFKRLQGYDVFEPIGLDGFGIHGENYAMKINEHPMEVSKRTEKHFYEQFLMCGNAFDWTRTLDTYKSNCYKWTQWAFLQLYKKGLAYRKKAEVNWCPSCLTVLADEQVITGECERCSSQVVKKELEQWFFKITDYAGKLLLNIDSLDWSDIVKVAQRNWIGKSEGALIRFQVTDNSEQLKYLEVFTTRSDTIFGATFIVISPEHPFVASLLKLKNQNSKIKSDLETYVEKSKQKSDIERQGDKDKTGVFTGSFVKNPLTGKDIPVWVADYVLMGYGTGAIMAVPAHDQRDFEFAKKFGLEIKSVIEVADSVSDQGPVSSQPHSMSSLRNNFAAGSQWGAPLAATPTNLDLNSAYEGEGVMINSEQFNGLNSAEARGKITNYLVKHHLGSTKTQYHLRDWLISRQRYWGPPIPIIYCDKCGIVPVPEKDLPVELPYIKDFKPTGTGVGPLASDSDFVNTTCPKCKGKARRETDVSDNFLDSSLYFFRYLTTDLDDKFFDFERTKKWLPVDMYIGGAEHSVLHLLYSRFITMAFKDLGFIDFEEPFAKFRAHGLIIKDGAKMSKSKGNVIVPDKYINDWGADIVRTYLMFMGPFTGGGDFQDDGLNGIYRFLNRIWSLVQNFKEAEASDEEKRILNKTIQKAALDFENLHYNTVVSGLMELLNFLSKQQSASKETIKAILVMLSPLSPFITEELWEVVGEKYSIHQQNWPEVNQEYLKNEQQTVAVQVNGKLRDIVLISFDILNNKEVVEKLVKGLPKISKIISENEIKKTIYVSGKIFNIVI